MPKKNALEKEIAKAAKDTKNVKAQKERERIQAEELKAFIDRIERLEEEKANVSADIREIYKEAKEAGYNTTVMRTVVKIRKMDESDFAEYDELTRIYLEKLEG